MEDVENIYVIVLKLIVQIYYKRERERESKIGIMEGFKGLQLF